MHHQSATSERVGIQVGMAGRRHCGMGVLCYRAFVRTGTGLAPRLTDSMQLHDLHSSDETCICALDLCKNRPFLQLRSCLLYTISALPLYVGIRVLLFCSTLSLTRHSRIHTTMGRAYAVEGTPFAAFSRESFIAAPSPIAMFAKEPPTHYLSATQTSQPLRSWSYKNTPVVLVSVLLACIVSAAYFGAARMDAAVAVSGHASQQRPLYSRQSVSSQPDHEVRSQC